MNPLFLFKYNNSELKFNHCNFEYLNPIKKTGFTSLISNKLKGHKYIIHINHVQFNKCYFIFGIIYLSQSKIQFNIENVVFNEYNKYSIIYSSNDMFLIYLQGINQSLARAINIKIQQTINVFKLNSINKVEIKNFFAYYSLLKINILIYRQFYFEIRNCNFIFDNFSISNLNTSSVSLFSFYSSQGNFSKSLIKNIQLLNSILFYLLNYNNIFLKEIFIHKISNTTKIFSISSSNKFFIHKSNFNDLFLTQNYFGNFMIIDEDNIVELLNSKIMKYDTFSFSFDINKKNRITFINVTFSKINDKIMNMGNDNIMILQNLFISEIKAIETHMNMNGIIKGKFRNKISSFNFKLINSKYYEKKGFFILKAIILLI